MNPISRLKKITADVLFALGPEKSNVAVFYRDKFIASKAKKIKPDSKVLDVGAGTAPYRKLFKHCTYKTHDFGKYRGQNKGPLPENWQYDEIDIRSDINHIPVKAKSFDVIICTEVLEHVPEPIKAIKEMSRILKTGGLLLLTAPLASGLHQEPYHFYGGFTPHFYRYFLPKYNLVIKKITPTGGLFKHVGQEIHRVGYSLRQQHRSNIFMHFLLTHLLPNYLWQFDTNQNIPEFTMDYLIEAVKK